MAENATNFLYNWYNHKFVDQSKTGHINNFCVDFLEDENGHVYFLKVNSFSYADKEAYHNDWKTSTDFTERPC